MPDEHDNSAFLKSRALAQKGLADTRNFVGEQLTDPLNYVGAGVGKVGKLVGKGMLAAATALKGSEADAMMFGGKWVSPSVIQRLEALVKSGKMSPNQIFKATGHFQDPTGQWKKYIPDTGASLDEGALKALSMFKEAPLGSVLKHPELYKAAPEAANIPVKDTNLYAAMNQITGSFDPVTGGITVSKNQGVDKALDTVLHEIQHYVQNKGGVTAGANVQKFLPEKIAEANKITSAVQVSLRTRLDALKKKYPEINLFNLNDVANADTMSESAKKYSSYPAIFNKLSDADKEAVKGLSREYADYRKASDKLNNLRREAFKKYSNNPGEVEARVTGTRAATDLRTLPEHPSYAYEKEITDPELFFNQETIFPRTIK